MADDVDDLGRTLCGCVVEPFRRVGTSWPYLLIIRASCSSGSTLRLVQSLVVPSEYGWRSSTADLPMDLNPSSPKIRCDVPALREVSK